LKATLGNLAELYKAEVGDEKALEKVLEVSNLNRVISTHDNPTCRKPDATGGRKSRVDCYRYCAARTVDTLNWRDRR
jgi:hypothetical protein